MSEKEIIEVVQAHMEGKKIECSNDQGYSWVDALEPPCWNFSTRNYRIKPEPRKPREWWIFEDVNTCQVLPYKPHAPLFIHVREVIE